MDSLEMVFHKEDKPRSIQELNECLKVAEQLAQLTLAERESLRPSGNGKTAILSSLCTGMATSADCGVSADSVPTYVPPRHVLLYLVRRTVLFPRMGSFTSRPQMPSNASDDEDVIPPEGLCPEEFLEWVRLPIMELPALPRRFYRRALLSEQRTCTFRLLQWNILAQALGTHADNFVRCPPAALQWVTRRHRIVEEILSHAPDIICLQEVDRYPVLERLLAAQGFEGVFLAKPDSPCIYLPGNSGPDGCALFYRTEKFSLLECKRRVLEVWRIQSNQQGNIKYFFNFLEKKQAFKTIFVPNKVALLMTLKENASGSEVTIVTTHLKARKGALLASLRNEQGKDLLRFLEQYRRGRPAIVCGDMNAEPTEPVYTTLTQSQPCLTSAYAACYEGLEPPYSSWKIRADGEAKHTIDYVLYTNQDARLQVLGVLEHPSEEDLGPDKAPSFVYPSDHFSLVCDFAVLSKDCEEGIECPRCR